MGLILRSSSLANPGDSVTVKGSTLDWVEGDGNFVYLLNKINSGGGGTPAGSDTQIQYNNAGAFGADSGFTRTITGVTNISSTFGTDTFGLRLYDNILGEGLPGSIIIASNTGGDSLVSGLLNNDGVLGWLDFYTYADGNVFQSFKAKNSYLFSVANTSGATAYQSTSTAFSLVSAISGVGGQGISQTGGVTTIGNTGGDAGGNNTTISIDDVNEQITISNLPAYDNDTAAGTAGLTAGMVYMTTGLGSAPLNTAGILMIKQ